MMLSRIETPVTMEDHEEALASLTLSITPGIGRKRFQMWFERCGSARAALEPPAGQHPVDARSLAFAQEEAGELFGQMRERGIELIPRGSSRFPLALQRKALLEGCLVPPYLCVAGDLDSMLHQPRVAILGARKATWAGARLAEELAASLARRGFTILSGYARGIDTAAHRGALVAGGQSLAVIPNGILRHVPNPELAELDGTTLKRLTLLSEFHPHDEWTPAAALERNATILALSDIVVAIEGKKQSGAMSIAAKAGRIEVPVFAPQWPRSHLLRSGPAFLLNEGTASALNAQWPPYTEECADRIEQAVRG